MLKDTRDYTRQLEQDGGKVAANFYEDIFNKEDQILPGIERLSSWQVHSAHLVASEINSLSDEGEAGPFYVPMPPGSGKTTGAIWGIIQYIRYNPGKRLCFMSPYIESVDRVYAELVDALGEERVGRYHSEKKGDKLEALRKPILLVTHQFIQHNYRALEGRDAFVVDEAIYETCSAKLSLIDFEAAHQWSRKYTILSEEFSKLIDLTRRMEKNLLEREIQFLAVPPGEDLSWAEAIANDLNLTDHSQLIDNWDCLSSVQRFCSALTKGGVFLSRGRQGHEGKGYALTYVAATLGVPRLDKTVVLTATGGLLYDVTGNFREADATKQFWTAPSFENLTLVKLSGPFSDKNYKTWRNSEMKETVVAYVDKLLSDIPEDSVYISLPKAVVDGCLRDYIGWHEKGEIRFPYTFAVHEKKVILSHHLLSVGSNEFKDCKAVIYLWDNHLPKEISVQRYHTLSGAPVTQETLESANSTKLSGDYASIRDAMYLDNMMQQIGRGNVRNIEDAIDRKSVV